MKPDLRPEWGIVRPLMLYMAILVLLTWIGHTFFHLPLLPLDPAPPPRSAH